MGNNKISTFNLEEFKIRNANKLLILSVVLFCLFSLSLFKNISYPLFWADESMTAIGSERVLEFGYPKVHDGKNVFYDLRHSNPTLGINEKDDAYVGGTGWGHYYYGIIGYKLAEKTDDIYIKTGIYRSTFALAGLVGLLLIAYFFSRFFPDKFSKYAFVSLFLLLELTSVSLVLLLREVRYYSLVILLISIILGVYCSFRFYKPFNKIIFIGIESIALCLLFITFSPVYFICIATIGISELVIAIPLYFKSNLITAIKKSMPATLSLIISFIIVAPLLSYFKTFEISRAMNEYNGFNKEMYWDNFITIIKYFKNFEFLLLAIAFKLFLLLELKKNIYEGSVLFKVSNFLTLFFVISLFFIPNIPNFIYTRYIIYLQPILSLIIIIDFFSILNQNSKNKTKFSFAGVLFSILIFAGMFSYIVSTNHENIKGHFHEMGHIYKGPLDFTIPYIKEKYIKTDTLIIAANYEETSYMYYLKSKVVVGFLGNNLREDVKASPDIIAYRKAWGEYANVFQRYAQKEKFEAKSFPVFDAPFNNIPELNYDIIRHQFENLVSGNQEFSTYLYIRK